jgi:hypothetical protein
MASRKGSGKKWKWWVAEASMEDLIPINMVDG